MANNAIGFAPFKVKDTQNTLQEYTTIYGVKAGETGRIMFLVYAPWQDDWEWNLASRYTPFEK